MREGKFVFLLKKARRSKKEARSKKPRTEDIFKIKRLAFYSVLEL